MESASVLFNSAIFLLIVEIVLMVLILAPVFYMVFQILSRFNRLLGKVEQIEATMEDSASRVVQGIRHLPAILKSKNKVSAVIRAFSGEDPSSEKK